MDFGLRGRIALVTGGSRGIGRQVALTLAAEGADVAICGRSRESLDAAVAEIASLGVRVWGFQADVSRVDEVERLVAEVARAAGPVGILVNNAVSSTSARFDELTDDEFRYHIDVKLMAYIRIARLVLPQMTAQGWGRIVNVGGMTARIVAPLRMTNGVVNAGVANFTKQFAGYTGPHGVTVNCVHPGLTATERVMQIFAREAAEAGIGIEDIAGAVLFFCSPLASMVTGQCIAVDGGSGEAVIY
jgi:NAD(P)-dependent dehydrogenase (short-subunit alcohol dehydrogenase family)